MKHPFRLSKSNKVFSAVIIIVFALVTLLIPNKTAFAIGEIFGYLIAMFSLPLLLSWGNWMINGKKKNAGTITFNIALALMVVAQIGAFSNKLSKKQSFRNMLNDKQDLKENLIQGYDSIDVDSLYSSYSQKQSENLKEVIRTSTGREKRAYQVLYDFKAKADTISTKWSSAWDAVLNPRILDFSLLDNQTEIDYQVDILNDYYLKTTTYESFYGKKVEYLKNQLQDLLDEGDETASGILQGVRKRDSLEIPVFSPLMKTHKKYGLELKEMLLLLKAENGDWILNDVGELEFEDVQAQAKCDSLFQEILDSESAINDLAERLVQVM